MNMCQSLYDKGQARDPYIDFLRGTGLLLLIISHTWAPEWLLKPRCFDVPLMVFVSAICYKPLRGGYLAYAVKRFKRIYIPVFVFLTLLYGIEACLYLSFGICRLNYKQMLGSYLLLYKPGIGFVWIMRVFLLMALVMPFLYKMAGRISAGVCCAVMGGIIIFQTVLILCVESIPDEFLKFVTTETLVYAVGYSVFAIFGLKIQKFNSRQLVLLSVVCVVAVIGFIKLKGVEFYPSAFKYPPQSLYLIYGVFGCAIMMLLKPCFVKMSKWKVFRYLSENSMWLYLWHIVVLMFVSRLAEVPNFWFGRYLLVIICSVVLNEIWHVIIKPFPKTYTRYLV